MSTKAITSLFKLLVFFTPIIFVANTQELFEFPKMYTVYALGTTIIWIFLLKKIRVGGKFIWPSKQILLFLTVYLLSTVFSTHPYTSVWGYYTRFNGGLASVLIFIGLYWVAINEYSKKQLKDLIKVACFSLIPIGLYSIMQHYEATANVWEASTASRAFSTFGQPNWLAAYVTMLLPISLGQIFNIKNKKIKSKRIWFVIYAFGFSALWFSQSISGIISFVIATIAFILLNKKNLTKNRRGFSLLMAVSLLFAIVNPGIFKERIEDIFMDVKNVFVVQAQGTDVVEDLHNISDPGFIRRYLWKGTVELIVSSNKIFLIGTGPETFAYEFQKFRPEELNYSSEWNFVFNKPHNYYLELFSNIGLAGLAAYLLLVKKVFNKLDPFFAPGLIALFVTNFFGWPTVSVSLLFWLFLAGIEDRK